MTTPKLYKHINNTDVAIEIIKRFYVREKDVWKFKVMWWNIVPSHPPYCIGETQRITVPAKVWDNEWEVWNGTSDA